MPAKVEEVEEEPEPEPVEVKPALTPEQLKVQVKFIEQDIFKQGSCFYKPLCPSVSP